MVRANTRAIGANAERLAARYLTRKGLISVTQNFNCRLGEIDLIMTDDDCLVFVEVRYRSHNRFSRAGVTVDARKQKKLIRTAALFLARRAQFANSPVRFDVVAIDADANNDESIEWIRDAFRPSDSSL